ncbi:MAG: filamentous hemagglutinin N-terminal domain-containing protein [Rhizomicrobium sp.]
MYSRNHWECTTALASLLSLATTEGYATSLPDHGHFVSGQGSIAKGNQSLTVKQSSTTGMINWSSFSVGKKNRVTFDNGSGATLNRVTGGSLSTIAGSLHATGSLYLINSAGAIVSGTGHIVTGGNFVATSGNVADSAFGDGDRRFDPGAGNVLNRGTIVSGGSVSLVGRNVSDSGNIRAAGAALSATQRLSISGNVAARTGNGSGGTITARAHTIVIGNDGDINASATSAHQQGGTISVVARGTTTVAGMLTAQGGGGFIETSGEHLHVADSAKISTLAANGKAGTWLIDPQDFTIAASGGDITGAELSNELASNDVDIQSSDGTKAGAGDIFVDDAVTWSSGSTLTLDAHHSIHVDAPITVTGVGGLTITTNDGGKNGDYEFGLGANGFAGHVSFTDVVGGQTKGSLLINGSVYHLANSVKQLAQKLGEDNQNYTEDWALANSYNAQADGTYKLSPISVAIEGTIEGLGNSISNLKIDDSRQTNVGLFGEIAGNIRDLGLQNETVVGGQQSYIGGLVGTAESFIQLRYDYVTGQITGGRDSNVGGLVGSSTAQIFGSHSSATVTGDIEGIAGGLVGIADAGSITQSFASGVVSGSDVSGGLVGRSSVTIEQSFATGDVSAGGDVGGLVGGNDGKIIGSYALGNVHTGAPSGHAGGLVGDSDGSIVGSYSIGFVDAPSTAAGGLVGTEYDTGKVKNSYWDVETSGVMVATANRHHLAGVMGETTAELQSGILSEFNSAAWGIVAGESFPYLAWQFPSGAPQVVSGNFLGGPNGAPVTGETIDIAVDGITVDPALSVESQANGYYYVLLAPGSITADSDIFAYADDKSGAALGAGLASNLNIYSGYLSEITDEKKYSATKAELAQALGGNANLTAIRRNLSNLAISAGGASFEINDALTEKHGTVEISAAGPLSIDREIDASTVIVNSEKTISEIGRGEIVATGLGGASVSGTVLGGNNLIGKLLGFTNSGGGGISLTDFHALDVTGAVNAGAGDLTVDVSEANGNFHSLNIDAALSARGTIDIESTDKITEGANGQINTVTLEGGAYNAVSLDGANNVSKIYYFSAGEGSGEDFDFTDDEALTVRVVEAEESNIDLRTLHGGITLRGDGPGVFANLFASDGGSVTLDSAGAIKAEHGGTIYADSIGGYSTGGAQFVGDFAEVENFTNTGGGKVVFDGEDQGEGQLTIAGTVNAGAADIYVPAGALQSLSISGTLQTRGTVHMNAQYISEDFSGAIIAHKLIGEVQGNGSYASFFEGTNTIAELGSFSVGDHFALKDTRSLTVVGNVSATESSSSVFLNTNAGGIVIESSLTANEVSLTSAANIHENANGLIIANYFTGGSSGNAVLEENNQISEVGPFLSEGAANFILNDTTALSIIGTISAQDAGSIISLTTTTGGITISNSLQASEVDLNSAAAIDASSGAIVAATLTGSSLGTANFGSSYNMIGTLGAFSTNSGGDFTLSDGEAFAVSGTVNAGAHDIGLTTTSGNVTIGAELDAGTVNLTSAGQATETSDGAIKTDLLNVAAQTGISLTSSNNDIVTIGGDTTTSGPNNITQ